MFYGFFMLVIFKIESEYFELENKPAERLFMSLNEKIEVKGYKG